MIEFAVFFFFAAVAVIFALVVILHRNPVVGALSLVASFFALAVMYVLLDAPFLAALQVFIRDVEHVLMPVLMILMYLTPILYPLTLVPESLRPWVRLNPFGWLVGRLRDALLDGRLAMHWTDAIAALIAVAVLLAGPRRAPRFSRARRRVH